MKKTIAAILSVCTLLSLCACGDKSTADTLHTNGVTDEMSVTDGIYMPSTGTPEVFDTVNVDDIISHKVILKTFAGELSGEISSIPSISNI